MKQLNKREMERERHKDIPGPNLTYIQAQLPGGQAWGCMYYVSFGVIHCMTYH